jgi:effector-binding domain-containing protein
MKTFKRILIGLLVLVIILLIVAYILPKTYKVERDISIKADKMLIYDLTRNLNKWDIWTAWTKETDSTAVFEIAGPDGQVGTVRRWPGKELGQGEMILTELIPGELVAYSLSFDEGKYISDGRMTIERTGDSCKVSWIDEGDLGNNPISRYRGLFMERMMAPDFEKGLAKLKEVAEARMSWPRIEEKRLSEQVVLLVRDSAGPQTYGSVMGKAFGEIMALVKAKKYNCTGAPFAIYLKWDSVTQFAVMDIGIPVEKAEKGQGRVRVETIPAQNVVMAYYFGPYDKTAPTYYILDQYVRESGKEVTGGPWEIYVTDPMVEKDTSKWETDIVFPVR